MRPTAEIRELLVLHMLMDQIRREITATKTSLRESGISVVDTKFSDLDVQVSYKCDNREQSAVFMKPMLDAEVRAKLRVLRIPRKKGTQ